MKQHAFVQGGTRGLGLAFARRLLERPQFEFVFVSGRREPVCGAFVELRNRHGDRFRYLPLDLNNESSIAEASEQVRSRCDSLHLLLNVAGVLHEGALQPEKRIEDLDPTRLAHSFATNAIGPALVTKHFLSLLNHKERAVLANLSARVGSIGDNRLGGWYGYRASKAAQNMFTRTLAIELQRRAPRVICLALHPGTVDTELSKPFQRRVPKDKLFSADRAADQLLRVIDGASAEDSGRFFAWDGSTIPW